jgi:hypothetical protein
MLLRVNLYLQVVAPFPGTITLESLGSNTLVLVPSEGSLKDIVIYISNVEPNSTISVADSRAVSFSDELLISPLLALLKVTIS